MVAVWQHDHVAVTNLVRDVFTGRRVEHLMSKALRRLDAIVVDLLELRLAVQAVVLVRREAAPVAGWIERLADHQAAGVRVTHKEIVDLSTVVAPATLVHLNITRPEQHRALAR